MLVLCTTSSALADGKIFSADSVLVPATVPDQQALIYFADGTQTLVIETSFTGEGDRFAWVVPLPNVPEVSAVSRGLFPTLQSVFRPRIVDDGPGWATLCVAGLVVFTLVLYRKHIGPRAVVLLIIATLIAISVLLPSLARSRTLGLETQEAAGVTIHLHERIGNYDVASISATQPDGLIQWLTSNGFRVEEADRAVIADYVYEGWAFAAVKLSREHADGGPASPHPLAFRFKTDTAVYPMRLTGTQSVPVSLDLYVFGPGRAATDHPELPVVQSAATERRPEGACPLRWRKSNADHIALVHPQLCDLVPGTPVATKLSGTLGAAAMARDVRIAWESPRPFRQTLYTPAGLRRIVTDWAVGILCVLASAAMLLVRFGMLRPLHGFVLCGLAVLTLVPASWVAYMHKPTTTLLPPEKAAFANRIINDHLLPTRAFSDPEIFPRRAAGDVSLFQSLLKKLLREGHDWFEPAYARNNFTGRLRIEEDSPGNYGIRQTEAGVEYLWYDQEGGEHAVRLAEIVELSSQSRPTSGPAEAER